MMIMDNLIATITKNSRERIEVSLSEFTKDGQTFDMVSVRVHYDDGSGTYRPGRNGLNVQVKLLPALVEALRQAEEKARAPLQQWSQAESNRRPPACKADQGSTESRQEIA